MSHYMLHMHTTVQRSSFS